MRRTVSVLTALVAGVLAVGLLAAPASAATRPAPNGPIGCCVE